MSNRFSWLCLPFVLTLAGCSASNATYDPADEMAAANPTPTPNLVTQTSELTFDFDDVAEGQLPKNFSAGLSGEGGTGNWQVLQQREAHSGGRVLAQVSVDRTEYRFPICVFDGVNAKDVEVWVHLKPISGSIDQAGGVIVRYLDKDNYYVARANAMEDNVRLYKMVKGQRYQIGGADRRVTPKQWHALKLSAKGDRFQVSFDGDRLFDIQDSTFPGPGKVGLWTKADSVTCFDDLKIETLQGVRGR
jgi:hypothetical protein